MKIHTAPDLATTTYPVVEATITIATLPPMLLAIREKTTSS